MRWWISHKVSIERKRPARNGPREESDLPIPKVAPDPTFDELRELLDPSTREPESESATSPNVLRPVCAADVVDKPIPWILEDHIPDETIFSIIGRPGDGKTTVAERIAADLSQGRTPVTGTPCEVRKILFLSNEDSDARIRWMLKEMGADLDSVFIENLDDLWLLTDRTRLENTIVQRGIRFVVIDSLSSHCGKLDLNSHAETAGVLVPHRGIAERHRCAIAFIHHLNKSQSADHQQRTSGSVGITASFRHSLHVAIDPDDPNMRLLANGKTNLCRQGVPSLRFSLSPCRWQGTSAQTVHEIYQMADSDNERPGKAEEWLKSALEEGRMPDGEGVWRDAANLVRQAESGFGISRRSLYRAAEKLNVERQRDGFGGKVSWRIRANVHASASLPSSRGTYGTNGTDGVLKDLTKGKNIISPYMPEPERAANMDREGEL